jgi:hypothetical protein
MSDNESKKSGGFKFKDSRRFDTEGNERSEESRSEQKLQSDAPTQEDQSSRTEARSRGKLGTEIDFSSFIVSLGTQALMQLGVMPAPDGVQLPVDRAGAKQTIDIIEMLSIKTAGNLDEGEEKLTQEILQSLKLGFVRSAQGS